MDSFQPLFNDLVSSTYVAQGIQNGKTRENLLRSIINSRKLPRVGLDEPTIEFLINEFSMMDSNNFYSNAGISTVRTLQLMIKGVGEREGRVYSSIVKRRNFGLAHGIGRSGEISEVQPKACGSSLIYKLATFLTTHCIQLSGIRDIKTCLVLPLATGMTLAMSMLALKKLAINPLAKYVKY